MIIDYYNKALKLPHEIFECCNQCALHIKEHLLKIEMVSVMGFRNFWFVYLALNVVRNFFVTANKNTN